MKLSLGTPQNTMPEAPAEAVKLRPEAAQPRLTNLLESIPDGFFTLDRRWRFTCLNRRAEEMLGPLRTSRSVLAGKSIWEEFPEVLGTEIEENYRRAAREQGTLRFQAALPPLSRWFEFHLHASPDGLSVWFRDITETRQAQEALRASEHRLRATFNQAAVGMTVASLDGRFEQVNQSFCEILGYSAGELIGHSFLEFTHPGDAPQTRENMDRLVRGKVPGYAHEKRYIRKDGQVVWGLTTVTVLKDASGRPERFIGVIEEITQRKRAEETVREAAQRLQLALAAGRLGDWSWDAASDLVTLGPGACRVFGLDPGTLITWTRMREMIHAHDRERARLAVERALATRTDYDVEYRVQRRDRIAWVAAKGRGVFSSEGAAVGMIGVVLDVTERKEAEELRSRLAAVVESSDDAIISLGLDAIITTWNKGAERTFGYTAAEVIGKSVSILIPAELSDEEPRIIQRLLRGERVDHYETVRLRKDGARLNVSLTVSALFDASGKIIGASKISRDITERKRAEEALRHAQEELRRHAERLEEQVSERTARLRETIQELEAFSYSVSHDMRSPLRAMQGYAEALLQDFKGQLDPTAQEYLSRIRRAASRMDLLIRDVLAFSRVAKGEIQLQPVVLEHVIRDVIQNYPELQESAEIAIRSPLPRVFGHEAYLTQIVSNLLSNAVKFVHPGTRAKVSIRAVEQGGLVHVFFEDEGIGIAPEHHSRIFQIFGRVYSDKKYEGTGIGLAIVKKAAERMGGTVALSSELGRGSQFQVILKAA